MSAMLAPSFKAGAISRSLQIAGKTIERAAVAQNYQATAVSAMSDAAEHQVRAPHIFAGRFEADEQIPDDAGKLTGQTRKFNVFHQNSILFAVVFQTPSTTVPSSVSNVTVNGLPVTEVLNISSSRASRADTSEMLFWMEW